MKRMLVLALAAMTALALTAGAVAAAPGNPKAKGLAKGIKVSRGATSLEAQAFWQRLVNEGVTVEVLAPAKDDVETAPAPANFDPAFPITNGRLALTRENGAIVDATGKINHTGGISLTEGTSSITLRNFRINLTNDVNGDYVSAQVSINNGPVARARVLELDLSGAAFSSTVEKRRRFAIKDVEVSLTGNTSALSLDQLFATPPATPFATDTSFGTLAVDTRIVGRRF